jgi:iron(III) transport system ATP-binding protein
VGVTTIMVTHDQEEALSMADRVVVMNHGVIEQCGTPAEVYEQPATPFVATFLGRVNILPGTSLGEGRYRVGGVDLALPADGFAPGTDVRIFVRPEDRHVEGDLSQRPNRLSGRIGRIDYLGTFCMAEVGCEGLPHPLMVSFSLNQLHDLGVREGGHLDFALRPDRVRVFEHKSP